MSRIRWVVALGVVIIFGVVLSLSGAVGADETADATPDDTLVQMDIDEDSIEMEATVGADGDADWRVIYRLDLDSDERRTAFEELQADIEDDSAAYLDPFEDRIRRTAESAEATTGREMGVRNFAVSTDRTAQPDAEFGEVIFEFEWSGFAAADDENLHAGDALDSLFLDEETSLTLRWDGAFSLDEATPQADTVDDRQLTWHGPREFDAGEPRVTLTEGGVSGADTLPWVAMLLVGLVVAVTGAGTAVYLKRRESQTTDEPAADEASDGSATQGPPSELLSNEERVLTLVEDNGGRIKQKKVAETLDWSAAMTSQVVGDLREEGEIETFRIGRENVLTLPEVDIVPDQDGDEDEDATA